MKAYIQVYCKIQLKFSGPTQCLLNYELYNLFNKWSLSIIIIHYTLSINVYLICEAHLLHIAYFIYNLQNIQYVHPHYYYAQTAIIVTINKHYENLKAESND